MSSMTADATQWYRADSRLGELYLGVGGYDTDNRAIGALGQACLLGDVELLLQAVELWQDIDIDPRPMAGSPPGNGCRIHIRAHARATGAPHADVRQCRPLLLEIPRDRLPSMNGVDAAVAAVIDTEATRLPASLTLAEVTLDDSERARLTPGALLLLPGSFSGDWRVSLRIDGLATQTVEGRLNAESRMLCIDRWQTLDAAAASDTARLRVDLPLSVDPLEILPAGCSGDVALNHALQQQSVGILDGEQRIAEGKLLAIGQGQAVLIERLVSAWT